LSTEARRAATSWHSAEVAPGAADAAAEAGEDVDGGVLAGGEDAPPDLQAITSSPVASAIGTTFQLARWD
jgi:hypothetical protein